MEITKSPVFQLLLLGVAMVLCVYLFLSLKRAISRLDKRGKTTEEFLSCVLSDQLYWSKEPPTNMPNLTAEALQWAKSVWPAAIAQALEETSGTRVEFECLPIRSLRDNER